MKKYQGEDISFSLKFNNPGSVNISNFTNTTNVIVYAYTDEIYVQKFSMISKDGYQLLGMVSPTELSGVITSEYTSKMCGQLTLEVMLEYPSNNGDTRETLINKKLTKIFISDSLIKKSI